MQTEDEQITFARQVLDRWAAGDFNQHPPNPEEQHIFDLLLSGDPLAYQHTEKETRRAERDARREKTGQFLLTLSDLFNTSTYKNIFAIIKLGDMLSDYIEDCLDRYAEEKSPLPLHNKIPQSKVGQLRAA